MNKFNITDRNIIITDFNYDERLNYVFEHLIKEGELKIWDCQRSLAADDSTTITGKTTLWDGTKENPNQASLTFKTSTEELIDFRIIRTNDEFEKLQFGTISFRDLKDELFIEIGPKGHPNNGLFNRVTSGFLQIEERSVELKMIERGGIYEMDISFTKDSAPSLKNLISIVGGDGKDLDKWLPEALTPFNVSVNKLFTKIDLEDEKKLTYTHCQLEFMDGKSWSLFPQNSSFSELLKVGELWIRLEVDHPLDPAYRFTTVALGGNIILGNPLQPGRLQLEARWPDLAISGKLKKGDTIELAWLLKKIGLPVAGPSTGEQALRISQLTFAAEPFMEKKSFAFNVEVDNVWKIKSDETDLFEIRSINFDIGYFEGAKPDKRGAIMAQLAILDYELFLSGSNDADGWLLKAWSSDNLILDDWITKIAGTEWSLPDGLSQLSLSNFSLSFHTGTKELAIAATVNGEIRIPLNGSSNFLEIKSLKFSFEKGDDATTISFEGKAGLELTDSSEVKQEFSMNTTVIYESKLGQKNTGWKIEAQSSGELDLVNLVSGLTSKFGSIDSSLPETLTGSRYALKEIYLNASNSDNSWNFRFGGTCKYELAGNEGILKVGIDFTKATGTSYTYKFNGDLNIKHPETAEEYNFQLGFDKEPGSMFMVAKYKGELSLKKVVSLFSPKVAEKIPSQLNPTMQDAAFLVYKKNKKTNILLAIRLDFSDKGNEIDLSRLAFIGKYIPAKDAKMELGLDFFLSTANIPDDQQDEFNKVLSRLGIPMDFPESIDSGLTLNPRITAPLFGSDLTVPVTGSGVKSDQKKANSKTDWKTVKKKIGPVTIERAGLTMEDGKVKILLDAGMELGGFTFKMLGFGVKIPIKSNLDVLNEIDFGLDGLELKIERGNIKISGGFYKQSLALKNRNGQWVSQIGYVGEIRILIGPKSLTAYAGYVDIDGIPSFFIYAIALLPLGGPAEFFIDGFAGGFGINSRLNIPPIEDVRNFIMVRSAFGEPYFDEKDQNASLSKIFNDIPPELDVNWIAIGIKANHYKFIESFFLATVSFGNKVELDLLGIARLKMPKGAEMLVKAELALHAHFVPEDGFLGIEGRLTDGSYILNPLARLSGGFAFYSWLSGPHKGDFVISLGGYHPQFKIPSHYPIVPRLALTYQLSSNIYIKASAYIALTPKMLMAGGRLEGLVDLDNIKASFVIEAHFLMNFKPFQYEIAASVAMGVSASLDIGICTLRKTWQITAGMELWGPEFGGFASIDLEIVEFTIDFGAPKALPEPISWQEFKDDFLPPSGDISKIFISDGIIKEIKSELYGPERPRYIVSPTALKIRVESSIPARKLNSVYIGKAEENKIKEGWEIGVAPMQLSASDFNPTLNVEFKKLSGSNDGTKPFKNDLLTSRVPSALWGTYRERSLVGPMLLPMNESDQPFVGLQFHPEKEISDRLPEIGSLSLTDVLKPSENIINLNPDPIEKSEQKVIRPNDNVGFFEILKSPERILYDKLINIKGFSHLPPADLQTFMPWTTPGGITEKEIDQFEDAPYLSSMGARENLIKWNRLK